MRVPSIIPINAVEVDPRDCFIFIYHTTASTKTATLNAGDNPPAMRQGGGNLVATMTDGSTTPTLAIISRMHNTANAEYEHPTQ
jgi:hypothetical protein